MAVISAHNLRKSYADVKALDGLDLEVSPGRIVGLIGPNGSGKTTALNAMLGLNHLDDGELSVLGLNPAAERAQLMQQVAYVADTGILPKWMVVSDLLDYVAAVHPRFDPGAAVERLARTDVSMKKKIGVLSKGMHVQLHLAIILAIDAPLLVLDEPTLGLDILYRQQFYDAVLNDYFNEQRSILVTTHEVREIEHILTDVIFIHRGKAVLSVPTEEIPQRFVKLIAAGERAPAIAALSERRTLNGVEYVYQDVESARLSEFGEVSTPNLAELFVAIVESSNE